MHALVSDPGGSNAPSPSPRAAFQRAGVAFRSFDSLGTRQALHFEAQYKAFTLAVYASQPGVCPPDHARLASGWGLALAGEVRRTSMGSIARFQLST